MGRQIIARLDTETRQERHALERDYEARIAAAESRGRDTIRALEQQLRDVESRSSSSSAAIASRERALAAEVDGLRDDLAAAREEMELLRMEAVASNRLTEDSQKQLDAVRTTRSRERDELRQAHEEEVRGTWGQSIHTRPISASVRAALNACGVCLNSLWVPCQLRRLTTQKEQGAEQLAVAREKAKLELEALEKKHAAELEQV